MECAVCKQEILDDEYTFITKNGNEVTVCESCLIHRPEQVEQAIAKVNVN